MSDPVRNRHDYKGGDGAVAAVKMAVAHSGGTVPGKKIEVISADHQNKADVASAVVEKLGGKVLGNPDVPLASTDFSSHRLQAQASGAKVTGLANAGQDTVNAIKQANDFGIVQGGQQLAGMLVLISDVKDEGEAPRPRTGSGHRR